jgi:hypothetical protein
MFHPSKKGVGLLPVTEDSNNPVTHLLEELNNDELFLTELPKKKGRTGTRFCAEKRLPLLQQLRRWVQRFL